MFNKNFYNTTIDINTMWYSSHKDLIEKIAIELKQDDKIDYLINRFLGKPLKFKKLKDPNAPKRPKTAFLYFCESKRKKIVKENPNLKLGDIQKILGKKWQNLSEKKKKEFINKNIQDKERYDKDLEEYNLNKNYF